MKVIIKQLGMITEFENVKKTSAIIPDDKSDTRKAISVTYDYYDKGVKKTMDKVIILDPSLIELTITDDAQLEQLCNMWNDMINTTNSLFSAYNWVKILKTLVERNDIGALKLHTEREDHNPTLNECVNALIESIECATHSNTDAKNKVGPMILSLGGKPEITCGGVPLV